MPTNLKTIVTSQLKTDLPDIRSGDTVRVHQKLILSAEQTTPAKAKKEAPGGKQKKERIQVFEGQVIARKHGQGITSTITVRKIISGVGVERIFPLHSPIIDKIEVIKRGNPRRAKLYYLRTAKGKRAKLKREKAVVKS